MALSFMMPGLSRPSAKSIIIANLIIFQHKELPPQKQSYKIGHKPFVCVHSRMCVWGGEGVGVAGLG